MAQILHIVFITYFVDFVSGERISIQNAGFETDFNNIIDNNYYMISEPAGWDKYNPQTMSLTAQEISIANPTGGTTFNDPTFLDGSPEGNNCLFIDQWIHENRDKGELGIFQSLSGNIVTVGTTYTLTVWIGNDDSNLWTSGWGYDDTGFPGYKVQLMADNEVLAEDNDILSIVDGQWKQSIVTYSVSSNDMNIGKTLGIRIINKNIDNNEAYGMTIYIDDVRLEATTASPTPSPTRTPTPPTPVPTIGPTDYPTKNPTLAPTFPIYAPTKPPTTPSPEPTPSQTISKTSSPTFGASYISSSSTITETLYVLDPTSPGTLQCGDEETGIYAGSPITFMVQIAFDGDITLDARYSRFLIKDMEAFNKLDVRLGTDDDEDETLTLTNIEAGTYKFVINGDPTKDINYQYDIRTHCSSHLTCGDEATGTYNDKSIIVTVEMDKDGELAFDARVSDFQILYLEGMSSSNEVLGYDSDHDGHLVLNAIKAGSYKFKVTAESGTHGSYNIKINCIYDENQSTLSADSNEDSNEDLYSKVIGILGRNTLYIIMVMLLIACCCCCICLLFRYNKEKHNEKQTDTEIKHMVEIVGGEQQSQDIISEDSSSRDEGNSNPNDEEIAFHRALVSEWLRNHVHLPQYLNNFLCNGFESMKIIKRIDVIYDLDAIGIRQKGHQAIIMREIGKLQMQKDANNGVYGEDQIQDGVEGFAKLPPPPLPPDQRTHGYNNNNYGNKNSISDDLWRVMPPEQCTTMTEKKKSHF